MPFMPSAPNFDLLYTTFGCMAASTLGVLAWVAKQARRELLLWPLFMGALTCLLAVVYLLDRHQGSSLSKTLLYVFAGVGLVFGLFLGSLVYRTLAYGLERLSAKLTQPSAATIDGPTDIRTVQSLLPSQGTDTDPRSQFQSGQFMLGVGEGGEPVVWQGALPHVLVLGTTGAGKGVFLQSIAAQSVQNGELLVLIDPKDDEWLPHSVYQSCQEHAKPYRYLQLVGQAGQAGPQINPLHGATAAQVYELFAGCMALSDTGKGADFYRIFDRRAARFAAERIVQGNLTLAQAFTQFKDDEFFTGDASGFLGRLEELAQVDAINAKSPAWTLQDMVQTGGAIYALGSMRDQSVKRAQQLVFIRLQQLAEERDRLAGPGKTITVVADEFKVQVCRPIVEGLATMRDKNMRLVIAMQSLQDLLEAPKDLDPQAVMACVVENTAAQVVYRIQDPETADLLARKSGTIRVQQVSRQVSKGILWTEATDGKSLGDAESYLFDTNKLMAMPRRWAVLFGQGVAQTIRISPIPVEKSRAALQPDLAGETVGQGPAGYEVRGPASLTEPAAAPTTAPTPRTAKSTRRKQQGPQDPDFFALD